MKLRKRIFEIITTAKTDDKASKIFDLFIITLIVLSVLSVITSSYSDLPDYVVSLLWIFEIVSVIIFFDRVFVKNLDK